MPRKSMRIRRAHGLLANDNPASTFPGQQSFKRWAKVCEKVGVLYECLHSASARSAMIGIGGREYAPHVRKMVCVYGVDFHSKYKPGFSPADFRQSCHA